MDIPAAQAAALVHRPVIVETADGPEEQLQPVFAHEVFAVALADDHVTVVTIDGRKLLGSLLADSRQDEKHTSAAAQASPEAALPEAPLPESQPAGEEISLAAAEAVGTTEYNPADSGVVSAATGAATAAPVPADAPATPAVEAAKPAPSRGKPAARSKSGGKNGGTK